MRFFKIFLWFLFVSLGMSLCFIPMGIVNIFGDIELTSIIFHIFMPQKNFVLDWGVDVYTFSFLTVTSTFLFLIAVLRFKKFKNIFMIGLFFLFLFDFYYINKHFSVYQYFTDQFTTSDFIEKHYVDPKSTDIVFPKEKQNLIFIQVESLESSMQDVQNGGLLDKNYIPELTNIAKQNINFSPSDLIGGAIVLPETGWTTGALIAQTAGIPLKSYKTHTSEYQIGNRFGLYESFLSHVVSLGDILKLSGYNNYFILGSFENFGAQGIYLREHGSYKIYDYMSIKNDMNVHKPDSQWWGLLDQDIYKFAQKTLLKISKQKEPFSLIIQTIDSHRDGFLSPLCHSDHDKLIKNVYACVSFQLNEFISWCMKQDFFKNTTIVIVGDHCNMSQTLFKTQINNKTGYYEGTERTVYNAFINSLIIPYKEKNRLFSTMDIFPTVLASIGAKIEGDRLGLGTNLFSKEKTLLEEYGYDYICQELRKKSDFYNHKLLFP